MAIDHYTMTATTTPQILVTVPGSGSRKVYIENRSTTIAVYVGDSSVTASDGYQLTAQAATGVSNRAEFELFGGDVLWVASASSTAVVTILIPGV
jgi:hypothetical protein